MLLLLHCPKNQKENPLKDPTPFVPPNDSRTLSPATRRAARRRGAGRVDGLQWKTARVSCDQQRP